MHICSYTYSKKHTNHSKQMHLLIGRLQVIINKSQKQFQESAKKLHVSKRTFDLHHIDTAHDVLGEDLYLAYLPLGIVFYLVATLM